MPPNPNIAKPVKPTVGTVNCPTCGHSMVDPMVEVNSLRLARKLAGRTLVDVAVAMGVSPQYLHDLEHGRRPWRAELLEKYRATVADFGKRVEDGGKAPRQGPVPSN